MESCVANFFGITQNLIVPNISWGLGIHECDLLIISKSGYATEVEIKISLADLIKDKKKWHNHDSPKIKYLYFAIPDYLEKNIKHIPEHAGILTVNTSTTRFICSVLRKPEINNKYKFSDREMYKAARLGAIRVWSLKRKINALLGWSK